MQYAALRPIYSKTGEVTKHPDGKETHWQAVRWFHLGTVQGENEIAALQNAKREFGGSPVLEAVN